MTSRKLLACGLSLVACLLASPAQAFHTDRVRTIFGNAFVLDKGEWEIGPLRANVGVLEQLQLGTYFLPLLILAPSLEAKLLLFQNERFSVSVRPSVFYANLAFLHRFYGVSSSDTNIKLWVIPVEGYFSTIIRSRFTLTASLVFTGVRGSGRYDPEDFKGTAAASNLQAGLGFEWRINRVTALLFQSRFFALQQLGGAGTVSIDVDDATDAYVSASGAPVFADVDQGYSFSASALLSFAHFNLRAGMGYGNYNLPGFNLVVPERIFFPEFDLFWRF